MRYLVAMAMALAFSSLAASAQARTMQQKLEEICAADIERLCPQAREDDAELIACLMSKRAKVSKACMEWVEIAD